MKTVVPVRAVLFDLGGVLVELTGVPSLMKWSKGALFGRKLWDAWVGAQAVRSFESGHLSPEAFAKIAIAELSLAVEPEEFLEEFARWVKPYPGACELVAAVGKRCVTACLSNTNVIHWTVLNREMDVEHCFHVCLPSHLTGRIKPDRDAFTGAAAALGMPAESILFLDDGEANVVAAQAAGLQACRVQGLEETAQLLRRANVL